jgi:hypothetical protein
MKGHLASSVIIIKFMANIIDMIEEELHANGINPYED